MLPRMLTLCGLLIVSWLVMTFTHEVGHIVGGWLGGATLTEFDVAPWRLPYSVQHPDPHPLLTLWSGPVFGVLVPGLLAVLIRQRWIIFIADFCLVANGAYLTLAWVAGDRMLDTPRLLDAGASPIAIGAFCLLATGLGYVRFRGDCVRLLAHPTPPTLPDTQISPPSPDRTL